MIIYRDRSFSVHMCISVLRRPRGMLEVGVYPSSGRDDGGLQGQEVLGSSRVGT